jgi:glucokinase
LNNDLSANADGVVPHEQRVLVGVDIGGTKTAVVLSRELPTVLARTEFQTNPEAGPGQTIDKIITGITDLLASAKLENRDVAAIGISCGGPLDRHKGVIQSPPNLPTWVNVRVVQLLTERFGVPCYLENDANAGAVAEHRFGAGRGTHNMIFLTMGTGLGAGLVLNGQLYRGSSEMAGEFGHVRLTPSGPIGHNKAGSVEGWASGGGMTQAAREAIQSANQNGIPTTLAEFAEGGVLTARHVSVAASQGDKVAKDIIRVTGERLGEALAILVDILNPECIVMGGLGMRLGEALLGPARLMMEREALPALVLECRLVPAALGESIGDVAALCVASGLSVQPTALQPVQP